MTMLPLINAVLLTLSVLALLPVLAFCLETVLALLPRKELHWPRGSPRPRAAVLIPAHNEELLLQQTLAAILPTLAPGDRVLVVADNCDDQTAEVSRRAGAEAVERSDPSRRGKGYALDYGLRALSQDPPDVVVVIDADCLLAAETVDLLARVAGSTLRPVQALNLTDRNPPAGPVQTVSTLANRFTNLIRPLGLARVNMPCRLMGTGMAIPWAIAGRARLDGGNLVEDMRWGIDLAVQGHLPLFCPEARVTSGLPPEDRAFLRQRTRWEHGHLRTAATQVPRLLAAAVRRGSPALLAMALDLSIPPLTLMVMLWLAATTGAAIAWLLGADWLPAALLNAGGLLLAVSIAAGWATFCRPHVPLSAFAAIPWYIVCKLPIYAAFLFRLQRTWERTSRDAAVCEKPVGGRYD